MARRRPQSFQSWALGLIGVLITCVVMYYARVAAIEYMAERQIERAQAAMAKLQEQAARQQQQLRPTPPAPRQVDQVMKAAAESQRQHDAAWDKFYQAPRGCDNWKTDQQMVECQNHKLRAKRDFEQQWAAGKLGSDA
ncbi:hypothetical protein [Pseudomonas nitroreducens]|uniref:hypothetical protein n=1 Tax=Pseudomonas nitroreducens TaxID=46680 RepID=UPI003D2D8746